MVLPVGSEWAIESGYAAQALTELAGLSISTETLQGALLAAGRRDGREPEQEGPGYEVTDGVALLRMEGPLTKKPTCLGWLFGGASTVEMRRSLRSAARDPAVREIVLCIDSPGGQVAGTFDLADEVARTAALKPVTAYIEDRCCSAAYAIASQASRIVANRSALVGAIGTYMVVTDSSRAAENAGITAHVIRAGEFKGAGTPGAALTDAHLAEFQRTVDALNAQFLRTVARGRNMKLEEVASLADGRVWVGADAVGVGLIDAIGTLDEAIGISGMGGVDMGLKQAWQTFLAGFRAGGGDGIGAEEERACSEAAGAEPNARSRPESDVTDSAFGAETLDELAAIRRQLAEVEAAKQAEQSARRDEILTGMKRDGLLVPAAEEAASRLLAADEAAFSAFIAKQGRVVAFVKPEDLPRVGNPNGAEIAAELQGAEQPFAVLQRVTDQIVRAKGIPYHVAFGEACRQRPDLAASYIEGERAK